MTLMAAGFLSLGVLGLSVDGSGGVGAELYFCLIVNQIVGFLPVINGIAARLDGEGAEILRAIL